MSDKGVFRFSSYKAVMKHFLRTAGERGALSRAALAINCQRSFLSRVMNSEIHLTPDHAFMLAEHWRLPALESEYFQTLVELERASTVAYRSSLEARATRLRKSNASLSAKLLRPPPAIDWEERALYFSSWQWTAIHFLTSAPPFQTVDALATRLSLSPEIVLGALHRLRDMGMVRQEKSRWKYEGGQYHLPKDSPYVSMHHQNWRARAVLAAQNPTSESLHFTNVQTIRKQDFEKVRDLLLGFVSDCKTVMDPSEPEDAVVVTCDLFLA